jgi:NAD(P)H-hydrate epimerase
LTATVEEQRPRLGPNDQVIDEAMAAAALPRRPFGAHKWGVGGLVIVAGAPGFAGAAALCAMAAGRAGVGIVNVAVPHGLGGTITALVPEAALVLLPAGDSPAGGRRAVELIEPKLAKSAALVVGPGLGQDEVADGLLGALFGFGGARGPIGFGSGSRGGGEVPAGGLVGRQPKPVVIDADGLNWLAKQGRWWERLPSGQAVLTPHVGEMERLLGKPAPEIVADPLGTVREAAGRWRQTVVLKFGYTAVSDGERTLVADDAPRSLATAGTGDVFAGMLGAFLAQGVAPLAAAALAILVGMRAARRVETRTGVRGLVAGDLPPAIAEEVAHLEGVAGVADG